MASLSPIKGTLTCSRCHRQSTRAWLIGKWLCVSCWNREREWVRGRHATGNRPTKMRRLDPPYIPILEDGRPTQIGREDCRDGEVAYMMNLLGPDLLTNRNNTN